MVEETFPVWINKINASTQRHNPLALLMDVYFLLERQDKLCPKKHVPPPPVQWVKGTLSWC